VIAKENRPAGNGAASHSDQADSSQTSTVGRFAALLLDVLAHRDGEFTSLLYENGAAPHTAVRAPADARFGKWSRISSRPSPT
jgi:hypothetical protein